MLEKIGRQQRDFLQFCKKVIVLLEKIETSDDTLKKIYITESAEFLKAMKESILENVKVFGDMDDYFLVQDINYEGEYASWTEDIGYENACKYVKSLTKVVRNIIEISKHLERKKCPCCQELVYFVPYSAQFLEMYHIKDTLPECYPSEETICPNCMSNDRDRALIYFLKKMGLDTGNRPVKVLQLTSSKAIAHWINAECPTVIYQSVDIDWKDEIILEVSQIAELPDKSYDFIFCTNILLYGKSEDILVDELKRILKPDGLCLFSKPCSVMPGSKDEGEDFMNMGFMKKFMDEGFMIHNMTQDMVPGDDFAEQTVLYILTRIKKDMDDIFSQMVAKRYDDNMENPLVSVIMSVYNHEKYVSQAIESVLNQSYENIEFLVADDGSMDRSVDEILKYEDRIDQIHLFDENGFGRIPFLLSIAKGKYIAVLDSDDYWELDKIERQVLYMETHSACGACFTSVQFIDANDEEMDRQVFAVENRTSAEWINYFYHYGNVLAYPSVMIKKELHRNVMNHASNFSILPDFVMWLHVALDNDIYLMERESLYYRWHGLNDSRMTRNRAKNEYFELCYCWLEIIKKMDSALFLKVFREELIDPNVKEPREILCEKALILLRSPGANDRLAGLFYVYELLSDPENKKIMQEKYHIGRRDIFEILDGIETI